MDCRNAEHELLQIEALSPDDLWPNELTNHVAVCGACRQKLEDLSNLERAWRDTASGRFGTGPRVVPRSTRPSGDSSPAPRPRFRASRWLTAASAMLAVGVGVGLLMPLRKAASADVIERLVDWNLNMACTPSAADRDRLYADQAADLKAEVLKAAATERGPGLRRVVARNRSLARPQPGPAGRG